MMQTGDQWRGAYSKALSWAQRNSAVLTLGGLVLITVAGAYLRYRSLSLDALWVDEVATILLAEVAPYTHWTRPIDPTPPIYYGLHRYLISPSTDPEVVRSLSLVFGVATIPAIFLLGHAIGGRLVGLWAAAFVCVSRVHIEYSQEARAYALLVFVITLSGWAVARDAKTVKAGHVGWWGLLAAIFTALAASTHLTGLPFAVGIFCIWAAARFRGDGVVRWLQTVTTGGLILTVLMLPALWHLSMSLAQGSAGWIEPTPFSELTKIYSGMYLFRALGVIPDWLQVLVPILLFAGATLALWRTPRLALIALFLALFPFGLWLISQVTPVLLIRTALPAVLGIAILFGFLASSVRWPVSASAGAVYLVVHLASTLSYEASGKSQRDGMADIAQALATEAGQGDLIITDPSWLVASLRANLPDDFPARLSSLTDNGQMLLHYPAPRTEIEHWAETYSWRHTTASDPELLGAPDELQLESLSAALTGADSAIWLIEGYKRLENPDRPVAPLEWEEIMAAKTLRLLQSR